MYEWNDILKSVESGDEDSILSLERDVRDSDNLTLFSRALLEGDKRVMSVLKKKYSDLGTSVDNGLDRSTPLHYAARSSKPDLGIVKWLVEKRKANVGAVNDDGMNALHEAVEVGNAGIVEYLVSVVDSGWRYTVVNQKNRLGFTPFLTASASEGENYIRIMEILEANEANLDDMVSLEEGGKRYVRSALSLALENAPGNVEYVFEAYKRDKKPIEKSFLNVLTGVLHAERNAEEKSESWKKGMGILKMFFAELYRNNDYKVVEEVRRNLLKYAGDSLEEKEKELLLRETDMEKVGKENEKENEKDKALDTEKDTVVETGSKTPAALLTRAFSSEQSEGGGAAEEIRALEKVAESITGKTVGGVIKEVKGEVEGEVQGESKEVQDAVKDVKSIMDGEF